MKIELEPDLLEQFKATNPQFYHQLTHIEKLSDLTGLAEFHSCIVGEQHHFTGMYAHAGSMWYCSICRENSFDLQSHAENNFNSMFFNTLISQLNHFLQVHKR